MGPDAPVFCAQCGPGYRLGADGCSHVAQPAAFELVSGNELPTDDRVETVLKAAALIRQRVLAAPSGRWSAEVLGSEGYAVMGQADDPDAESIALRRRPWVARCGMEKWETDKASAEHIAAWDPTMALTLAEFLEKVAQEHRPELEPYIYISDCQECPDGDCDGHERLCCWICNGQDEEFVTRVFYPCPVMVDATLIAETYLRTVA